MYELWRYHQGGSILFNLDLNTCVSFLRYVFEFSKSALQINSNYTRETIMGVTTISCDVTIFGSCPIRWLCFDMRSFQIQSLDETNGWQQSYHMICLTFRLNMELEYGNPRLLPYIPEKVGTPLVPVNWYHYYHYQLVFILTSLWLLLWLLVYIQWITLIIIIVTL